MYLSTKIFKVTRRPFKKRLNHCMLKIRKKCFGCLKPFAATFKHADIMCSFCTEKTFWLFRPLERVIAAEDRFNQVTSCYSFYSYQLPIKNLILATKIKKHEVCAIWLADRLLKNEEIFEFFASRDFELIPQSLWSRLRGKYCFHEIFLHRIQQQVPACKLRQNLSTPFSLRNIFTKRALQSKSSFSPSYRTVPDLSKLPESVMFDDIVTTGRTAAGFCKDSSLWRANWLTLCDAKRPIY